jgi:diguanylate cyclase (GGDEF)-like protein
VLHHEKGEAAGRVSEAPSAVGPESRPSNKGTDAKSRRGLKSLSIRVSLVVLVLIPLAVALGLATNVVVNQSSIRHRSLTTRESSLILDSLVRARADLYAEYVPTMAIVSARAFHVTGSALDALLGIDFQSNLITARQIVDRQPIFNSQGALAKNYRELVSLRRGVDRGSADSGAVQTFFNRLGSVIDARWQQTFDRLSNASQSSASLATKDDFVALNKSFQAFTSGINEEDLPEGGSLETLLTAPATPQEVQDLIVSRQQFEASARDFPNGLGPQGKIAWSAMAANHLTKEFSGDVQLAIAVGLRNQPPPLATNAKGIGAIGKAEVEWEGALTRLVLASSADLRVATSNQAASASKTLSVVFLFMLLLMLAVATGVLTLGRAIRRPLARLVAAAESVRSGELDVPELDESGPKELSLAAGAFNEMAATLRAVQTQAMALASGDLDDPVLRDLLPGRTGGALQSALTELQTSVRVREAQREVLSERATRDFLTGLLNRGAALESLERDFARARRSDGQLDLAVLFIDVDGLKEINDSLGHDGGDRALQLVADAIRATTRGSDIAARFGGDEFVVGWLGTGGMSGPMLLAQRICDDVSKLEVKGEEGSVELGCSIGVSVLEACDSGLGMVIERADRALYIAKANGRGQVYGSASE